MTELIREGDAPRDNRWLEAIPAEQWAVYARVLAGARAAGLRYALGGAFAAAVYSGRWRNTKDLDIYVMPGDRARMIEAVKAAGLTDMLNKQPYDRQWIFRASNGDIIVDVIWAMANQQVQVDEQWLTRGPALPVHGEQVRAIPAEELIWAKLYIVQRDRCDWPDVLNILYHRAERLDWPHLLWRVAEDVRLLASVLSLLAWLAPERARRVPGWVWETLHLALPTAAGVPSEAKRAALMDSRPWFFDE